MVGDLSWYNLSREWAAYTLEVMLDVVTLWLKLETTMKVRNSPLNLNQTRMQADAVWAASQELVLRMQDQAKLNNRVVVAFYIHVASCILIFLPLHTQEDYVTSHAAAQAKT